MLMQLWQLCHELPECASWGQVKPGRVMPGEVNRWRRTGGEGWQAPSTMYLPVLKFSCTVSSTLVIARQRTQPPRCGRRGAHKQQHQQRGGGVVVTAHTGRLVQVLHPSAWRRRHQSVSEALLRRPPAALQRPRRAWGTVGPWHGGLQQPSCSRRSSTLKTCQMNDG